ncbi:MAG: hypothetical protein QOG16_753, partial [Actinomycetota bacterium]|nr:hypothetical protein [Actinomycetota bacterium]
VGGGLSLTGIDVLAAWFTHDATNVYVHIQTSTNARAEASTFQTNVGNAAGQDCIQLRMTTAGNANDSFSAFNSSGDCGDVPTAQFGELLEEEGPDGTAILTGTFPRAGLTQLEDGKALTEPNILVGMWGRSNPVQGGSRIGTLEDTDVGTDYTISSGSVAPAPEPKPTVAPPGKADPPGKGKKNGCPKGKGKKKGACPKPVPTPAPSCPAYVPGEQGATAPTSIVTAAATEEKPVEVTIAAPAGDPSAPGQVFQNIQVDAAVAEAGLYVRYEFPTEEDHDIYLNYADGSEAAHTGGFNPAPFVPANDVQGTDGTGTGGHSEQGAEVLDGIRSADCAGYTLQMDSYLSMGGDMTLKLWLGEAQNDPAAPGGAQAQQQQQQQDAAAMFFGMLKMKNPMARSLDQTSGTPAASKGCTKGKGKKVGCKKPPVACSAFTPGSYGTDKPTVVVTDASTEEKPLEQTITLDPSLGDADVVGAGQPEPTFDYFNVQVDSAAADVGLHMLFEFPERRDYDMDLLHVDGSYAARSHDFNTICGQDQLSCSNEGHGGEGTSNGEHLIGIRTSDCGGWTTEFTNWLGEGGEMTVKIWLGETVNDPLVEGAEPHA